MTFALNPDQNLAATTLDRDVVVTAGAGSGKTRMLTQRFINAVVPEQVKGWAPASVDQIVAITFTEKAAGELAERVRLTLRDAGFVDEARRVDGAWVSTIHGLCSRLLRRHAFEAGVDPLFNVADTVISGRIRAEAFERAALRLIGSQADVSALFDAYSYNRIFDGVVAVTRELAVRGLNASDIEIEPVQPVSTIMDNAIQLFSEGAGACEEYAGSAASPAKFADSCEALLGRVLELRDSAVGERQVLAALSAFAGDYKPLRPVKGLEAFGEESKAGGTALKGQVGAALVAPYCRGIAMLAREFATGFAELKRSAGVLDFDDLQVDAVELLTGHPALAKLYRERFKLVMIDEFQDTDALQLRLVEALSRGDLCTVGDEKQSIYRFRGADIGVYRQHRADMAKRNALGVSLGVNYRSHAGVLAFVNGVFSSEEYFSGDLLRLTSPEGGRPEQPIDVVLGDNPRVEAIFVDSSAADGPSGRRAEARAIANRLATLRDAGVDPGDMVILVRAYSSAHVYANALADEKVPAIVVGGSRFFGLAEVSVMRALTRVIVNPADGSAAGELLASEFCPVSDDGLARLRLGPDGRDKRPLWEILRSTGSALDGDDGRAVRRLVELVDSARADVGSRPLADVLLQAVEDSGYDLRLLSQGNTGRDAFANVLKFARQAAAFEAGEGTGPAGFSAYLDAKERLGDVEAPASVADDDSSAVRIMSVHASKGLEFPVVVVPDLGSKGGGGSSIARSGGSGGRLRIALTAPTHDDGSKPPESLWAAEFAETEREESAEEGNRVLYVAFTRARDLLIVSGSMNMRPKTTPTAKHDLIRLARLLGVDVPITATGSWLTSVADGATGQVAPCRVRVLNPEEAMAESGQSTDLIKPRVCALAPAAGERFTGAASAIDPPGQLSYSSLHLFEECPRRYLVQEVLHLSQVEILEQGALDPTRFGSAMHAVLQLLNRDGSAPDTSRIRAVGRQYELDGPQLERLRRGVDRFIGSETARRAASSDRVSREMPFALPIASGSCILAGTLDLYARSDGDALIVDYKSGISGDADELSSRYELQARCYALAALADGAESVEVVFVRPEVTDPEGGIQEVRFRFGLGDEPGLRRTIESLHEQIIASAYEPLSGRDEAICGYCAAPVGLCPNARP